jgi:hypothetical protein
MQTLRNDWRGQLSRRSRAVGVRLLQPLKVPVVVLADFDDLRL